MKKMKIEVSVEELEYIVEGLVSSIYNDMVLLRNVKDTPEGVIKGWREQRPGFIRRKLKQVGDWDRPSATECRAMHDMEVTWLKRLLPLLPARMGGAS